MAMVLMEKDYIYDGYVYTYTESLAGAGNGSEILIPPNTRNLSVAVKASGGAKARGSLDNSATITAGGATYMDWPDGAVTTETSSILDPATASVQLVQTAAGTSTIKVRAQI